MQTKTSMSRVFNRRRVAAALGRLCLSGWLLGGGGLGCEYEAYDGSLAALGAIHVHLSAIDQSQVRRASGFLISDDGLFVTVAHLFAEGVNPPKTQILYYDGVEHATFTDGARLLYINHERDIAFLIDEDAPITHYNLCDEDLSVFDEVTIASGIIDKTGHYNHRVYINTGSIIGTTVTRWTSTVNGAYGRSGSPLFRGDCVAGMLVTMARPHGRYTRGIKARTIAAIAKGLKNV